MIAAWAREEVEGVDFGDERLDARVAVLLSELGSRPNLSIPAACKGRAEMEAAYRFFDNPKVSFQKVLAPPARQTLERMAAQETVLLVQDSSEIDLTRPGREVAGAGRLDQSRRGVLLHPLHAFTPDGTPLGTAWAHCQNRTEPKVQETPGQELMQDQIFTGEDIDIQVQGSQTRGRPARQRLPVVFGLGQKQVNLQVQVGSRRLVEQLQKLQRTNRDPRRPVLGPQAG